MPQSTVPIMLAVETSGPVCSVALQLACGDIVGRVAEGDNDHARTLTPLIEALLADCALSVSDLAAVALSAGPGSYTGLRIGYSVAKGLSFGAGVPIVEVSTLEALASGMLAEVETEGGDAACLVPMLDARRMEVYTQTFTWRMPGEMSPHAEARPLVLTEALPPVPDGLPVYYGGSGAPKAEELLRPRGWIRLPHQLRASDLLPIANQKYQNHELANVAYCEPRYFKEFIAQPSKPGVLDAVRARADGASAGGRGREGA